VIDLAQLRPALARATVLGAVLLLGACHKGSDTNRSASGEVLQGTISDNMLPLDKITSQPPLAAPTGKASGKLGGARSGRAAVDSGAADAADADTSTADATPAPAPAAAASGQ
jgi:hypothetical protein